MSGSTQKTGLALTTQVDRAAIMAVATAYSQLTTLAVYFNEQDHVTGKSTRHDRQSRTPTRSRPVVSRIVQGRYGGTRCPRCYSRPAERGWLGLSRN